MRQYTIVVEFDDGYVAADVFEAEGEVRALQIAYENWEGCGGERVYSLGEHDDLTQQHIMGFYNPAWGKYGPEFLAGSLGRETAEAFPGFVL